MATTKTTLILKASDDGQYTVDKSVAEKSGLIKMMIEGERESLFGMMVVLLRGQDGWGLGDEVKERWIVDYAKLTRRMLVHSRPRQPSLPLNFLVEIITLPGLHRLHDPPFASLRCCTPCHPILLT